VHNQAVGTSAEREKMVHADPHPAALGAAPGDGEGANRPQPGSLLGREPEFARIEEFLGSTGPSLLFTGEAGIGKTALWRAALRMATERGSLVLFATPAEAEAELSYVALGDLLADAVHDTTLALPLPQRRALEVALLLRPAQGSPPDGRAVALGTLATLRALAARRPVVVAVDDVQWLDRPSAAALGFALRRVDPHRVRAVLTCRTGDLAAAPRLEVSRAATRIEVGPLSFGATHRLLGQTLDMTVTHSTARRLHESAHGNPLHAMELGRAMQRSWPLPPDPFLPPQDIDDLVRGRLSRLPGSTQETLLLVAAMSRPTTELLSLALGADASEEVGRAVDAGLLSLSGDRLRFVHPLYASACYRAASPSRRRAAHGRLGMVAGDPEHRARHLAIAATAPSREVAEALDEGARHALRRGAPHAAAELAELARGLTGPDDEPARARRAHEVAAYLLTAGESAQARRTLEEEVARQPAGPDRARTLIALAAVLFEEDGVMAARRVARQAITEAGSDRLASAEGHLALVQRGELPAAEAIEHAQRALRFFRAEPDADPALLADALRQVSIASWQLGKGMPRDLMERAAAIESELPSLPPVAWRARTCMAECVKYLDSFEEADEVLRESERQAMQDGDVGSLSDIAGHRAELALWLGDWELAEQQADRAVRSARESDQRGRVGIAAYFRSLVHAHRGRGDAARADATACLEMGTSCDDVWDVALARSALGFLELSLGDPFAARDELEAVDAISESALLAEARQWRYLADYVEALVGCGELDAAGDRLARLERWARGMGTDWSAAMAARADGVVRGATGDWAGAEHALRQALGRYDALPLPFEQARTRLALGSAQRRARHRREARGSLQAAVTGFTDLGARLWAERARHELARLSGRPGAGGELTASERRVAELVAQGLSNSQVAATLVVSPRTVEAHLTRIYAKLQVRSRLELARRVGATTS
jgi:DNA-binding NarL/FixJ family response regulator